MKATGFSCHSSVLSLIVRCCVKLFGLIRTVSANLMFAFYGTWISLCDVVMYGSTILRQMTARSIQKER